ncbi:hypothetical protein VDG1235_2331 [Verrucomicrobiia bacterium DG1235]|nr:hypothetical protein VDG1235_2331 [Verrucomicrobiae bacterium DG1235]
MRSWEWVNKIGVKGRVGLGFGWVSGVGAGDGILIASGDPLVEMGCFGSCLSIASWF